jgi:hypothetical protein
MKRCPHCGESLLSPKERLPARLSELQSKILAYCRKPRKSTEIAEYIGSSMSGTYKSLRLLQRLDQIEKIVPEVSRGHNYDVKFVATGRPLALDAEYMSYTDKPMVMGVRL